MPTVQELKDVATELGLTFKAKATKPELEALIDAERERLTEEVNQHFVQANSTPIPHHIAVRLGLARPTQPRNVPMDNDRRLAIYQRTNGTSKLTGKQTKRLRKKGNRNM